MPSFTGRFEYLERGRVAVRSGDCQLGFDERTVTVVTDGEPLAFDLGDVDAYEPGEFQLRLSLFDGHDLVLTRFAKAFNDMERQLREAYRDRLVQCLLVSDLDEVARFAGQVRLESMVRSCAGPAELRLYESNLAVLPDSGTGFQWRLAEIDRVAFDEADYAVTFDRGPERLVVSRLAKRTAELADRVRSGITALKERAARALHGVFPFLSPDEFTRLAAAMPEGTSASMADIGGLHRLVGPSLLEAVVDVDQRPFVTELVARSAADWYVGFKIVRAAPGGMASTVDAGEDGGEPAGDGVARGALDVGDGLELLFWFLFPLAAGGGSPTPAHLAWETTSRGGRATYVFRLAAGRSLGEGVAAVSRGLAALNFRREPVYLDARRLESEQRYRHYAIAARRLAELRALREVFVGRAIHSTTAAWSTHLDGLLTP